MERERNEEAKSKIRVLLRERRKKNVILKTFLGIFMIGYLFFLTSKSWYPSTSDLVRATEIHTASTWEDRTVTLLSWDYSQDQKLMEVKLDIKNSSLDGIQNYEFSALDRKKGFFDVEKVLEEDDYVVLHIIGVHRKWSEISLRMSLPGEDDSSAVLKLYTNVNEINLVSKIDTLTSDEYQAERINIRVQEYEELIASLESENVEYQDSIDAAQDNISKLQEEKAYQTEQEQEETEQLISKTKTEIEQLQAKIDQNEDSIAEYRERIENAKEERKQYE